MFITSCDKEVVDPAIVPYIATSLDEKAGSWKPYILINTNDIFVPEPKSISDPIYLKELDSLKNYIAPRVTTENIIAINYC